jgi:tetratricopeptide (TPR) repeat protein
VVEAKAPAGGSDRAAGRALRTQTDADGAEAVIDGLTRCLAEPDLPRGQRLVYLLSRANAYGAVERFEEGLADADEATRLAAALGFNGPGARSAELAGMLTDDAGRPEEAASRLRYAVRLEELEGSRNPSAKFRLARVLYKLDQDLDAAELFADVLEIEQAQQAGPAAIADTLEWLGRARQASGQPGAALSAWAQAVTDYTDGDRPADSIRVLWRMGNLLRLVEDWEEAVDQFDEAVEALDELDWQADKDLHELGVMVLEARALARAEAGLDGAVDDLVLARQTVLADGEAWRAADLIDTKARIMVRLDRPEDAVKEFLESADAYRGAGDQLAGARSELLAAGVLSGTLEREDEARVILDGALRSLADVPPEAAEGASSLIESVQAALSELA